MAEAWEKPDDGEAGYGLVWRFVDQSPAFVLGVEAGIIYERMSRREQTIEATIHAANDEEIHNLANSMDYSVTLNQLDEQGDWMHATLTRSP